MIEYLSIKSTGGTDQVCFLLSLLLFVEASSPIVSSSLQMIELNSLLNCKEVGMISSTLATS